MNNEIQLRRLDKSYTIEVTVTVTREFKVRMWLATKLIELAVWITGAGIEIQKQNSDADKPE